MLRSRAIHFAMAIGILSAAPAAADTKLYDFDHDTFREAINSTQTAKELQFVLPDPDCSQRRHRVMCAYKVGDGVYLMSAPQPDTVGGKFPSINLLFQNKSDAAADSASKIATILARMHDTALSEAQATDIIKSTLRNARIRGADAYHSHGLKIIAMPAPPDAIMMMVFKE